MTASIAVIVAANVGPRDASAAEFICDSDSTTYLGITIR